MSLTVIGGRGAEAVVAPATAGATAAISRKAAERLAQSASAAAGAKAMRVRGAMRRVYAGNGAPPSAARASREAAGDRPMYASPPRRGGGISPRACDRQQGAPVNDPAGKVVDNSIVTAEARVALERLRELAAELVAIVNDPHADDETAAAGPISTRRWPAAVEPLVQYVCD